jgi:hypothetical protein
MTWSLKYTQRDCSVNENCIVASSAFARAGEIRAMASTSRYNLFLIIGNSLVITEVGIENDHFNSPSVVVGFGVADEIEISQDIEI